MGEVWCKIRESNGTPLQYSCLENPRDGGAWWAAVYGVAQSRTRLKRRSSSSSSSSSGTKSWAWPRNRDPLCVPFSLQAPANIYLPNRFFSISMWIASLFWSLKPVAPTFSFVFSWRWYLMWGLQLFWWDSVSLGLSHVYILLNFGVIFSYSSVLYQFNC